MSLTAYGGLQSYQIFSTQRRKKTKNIIKSEKHFRYRPEALYTVCYLYKYDYSAVSTVSVTVASATGASAFLERERRVRLFLAAPPSLSIFSL